MEYNEGLGSNECNGAIATRGKRSVTIKQRRQRRLRYITTPQLTIRAYVILDENFFPLSYSRYCVFENGKS